MWRQETNVEKPNAVWKYYLFDDDKPVSFDEVIQLWQSNIQFIEWFVQQIVDHELLAIRWETPMVYLGNRDRQFEYVVVNSPGLDRPPNPMAFSEQFKTSSNETVIAFQNLGKNATLVVPTPSNNSSEYCHLMSFLRNACRAQVIEFWQQIGQEMEKRISDIPVWLNTAGGGVPWLHIRLDDRPKYYTFQPYREETR